jgi:hypothetical protein
MNRRIIAVAGREALLHLPDKIPVAKPEETMANSQTRVLACVGLLASLLMVCGALAAPYEVQFHSGTVIPVAGRYDVPAQGNVDKGTVHALVQIEDYLHKGEREALKQAGVDLLATFRIAPI